MHKLAITPAVWADSRFQDLASQMRWGPAETLGVLCMLWSNTRRWEVGELVSRDQVLAAICCPRGVREDAMQALADAGYIMGEAQGWRVVDNARYFEVSTKMRAAGKKGGYHKHAKRKPTKLKAVSGPSPAAAAWDAYASAFHRRYGVTPRRNARVNGQMAQLVACVGAQDAAALAAWYVGHEGSFYVRSQHPVGALLKDYSGLHTQMMRGQAVTEHDVQAHSENQRLSAQLQRFVASVN